MVFRISEEQHRFFGTILMTFVCLPVVHDSVTNIILWTMTNFHETSHDQAVKGDPSQS
jgi:hypothetical protein